MYRLLPRQPRLSKAALQKMVGSLVLDSVLRDIKLLMLVIFDAHTVLIVPAVPFSIKAALLHESSVTLSYGTS
jgi:hypothetical protein